MFTLLNLTKIAHKLWKYMNAIEKYHTQTISQHKRFVNKTLAKIPLSLYNKGVPEVISLGGFRVATPASGETRPVSLCIPNNGKLL